MKIYNETKTEIIENPNLELGELIDDTLTTHIPYSPKRERKVHEEVLAEYPNGGKETIEVVDEEEREEILEHDETEEIKVYIPYTAEEVAKRKAISLRSQLENYLSNTDYAVIKCKELGLDIDTEYPNLLQNRQQARDRINQIDSEYPEILAKATEFPLASIQ